MRVIINMAMSADGKVATPSRAPTTFTGREDRRRLMEIRARCDALVVGARTATVDCQTHLPLDAKDPYPFGKHSNFNSLGIPNIRLREERLKQGRMAHPVRVIVSGNLTLSPHLSIFQTSFAPLLLACTEQASLPRRELFSRRARVVVLGRRELDAPGLMAFLQSEFGARTILCEGGPVLNDAFFRAGVVDELFLTLAPWILGGLNSPTLVEGKGFGFLKDAPEARLLSCSQGPSEWFLHYQFQKKHSLRGS